MLAFALLLATAQQEDPIAPALQGQLQCYSPDTARKTCQSLAGYAPDGKGGFLNTAEVLVATDPVTTMRTASPVTVRDGAICGYIRAEDLDNATIRQRDRALSAGAARPLINAVKTSLAAVFGREICTRYIREGDKLIARGTLAGSPDGLPDQPVLWVSPEEGYRVGS